MPTIADSAIVIRQWDFSETSQMVSLFTRDHGVIRGLAKGSRREKGNFSGGLDVLTGGQIVAIIKPGRDLATLTAWHVQQMYPAVRNSLPANRAAQYMADLIHHMIIDHDPHPAVFEAFTAALDRLSDQTSIDNALLAFQWSLLRECGYEPQVDRDAVSGKELPTAATTFTFSATAGGIVIDAESGTASESTALSDDDFIRRHDGVRSMHDRSISQHDVARTISNQSGPIRTRSQITGGTWRVRAETVEVLRAAAQDRSTSASSASSVARANRLLAAYIRELLGSEPAAMRWAFSDLGSHRPA